MADNGAGRSSLSSIVGKYNLPSGKKGGGSNATSKTHSRQISEFSQNQQNPQIDNQNNYIDSFLNQSEQSINSNNNNNQTNNGNISNQMNSIQIPPMVNSQDLSSNSQFFSKQLLAQEEAYLQNNNNGNNNSKNLDNIIDDEVNKNNVINSEEDEAQDDDTSKLEEQLSNINSRIAEQQEQIENSYTLQEPTSETNKFSGLDTNKFTHTHSTSQQNADLSDIMKDICALKTNLNNTESIVENQNQENEELLQQQQLQQQIRESSGESQTKKQDMSFQPPQFSFRGDSIQQKNLQSQQQNPEDGNDNLQLDDPKETFGKEKQLQQQQKEEFNKQFEIFKKNQQYKQQGKDIQLEYKCTPQKKITANGSSTKKKSGGRNYETLYQDAIQRQERLSKLRDKYTEEKVNQEAKELTFTPKISQNSEFIINESGSSEVGGCMYERNLTWQRCREKQLEKLKNELQEEKVEYSFKPDIVDAKPLKLEYQNSTKKGVEKHIKRQIQAREQQKKEDPNNQVGSFPLNQSQQLSKSSLSSTQLQKSKTLTVPNNFSFQQKQNIKPINSLRSPHKPVEMQRQNFTTLKIPDELIAEDKASERKHFETLGKLKEFNTMGIQEEDISNMRYAEAQNFLRQQLLELDF